MAALLPRLGRRSAKMVATLGPASSNPEVFRAMVKAGGMSFSLVVLKKKKQRSLMMALQSTLFG